MISTNVPESRTAFVIGSTAGLGKSCAEALAAEGVRVAVSGRRGELACQIAGELPDAIGVELDVCVPSSVDNALSEVNARLGPVDILILNSGGPPPGAALHCTTEELERAMESILYPAQQLIRDTVPGMISRGWGRLIAIGSSGVQQPIPGLAASNAARAALAALLKTLAGEVAGQGVTVNMVIPGRFATDRVAQLDARKAEAEGMTIAAVTERSQSTIPAGRYGMPDELGALVAFLCRPEASYITGSQMRVDGGMIVSAG